jgi:DNA mismatch repair protein MutS2
VGELIARLDEVTRDEAEKTRELARRDAESAARLAAAAEVEARARRDAQELLERARRDAAALLTDIRRTVNEEKDRLRKSERSRTTLDESRRRLADASARVQPPPPAPETRARLEDLVPGASVAADHLGVRGELVAVVSATATVRSGRVTVRVPVSALRLTGDQPGPGARGEGGQITRSASRAAEGSHPRRTGSAVTSEIHLLGQRADEARDAVERYLDQAFLAGLPTVRVVHGKGTGVLRRVVREMLASHPHVASYRDGEPSEGGAGATVAALKVG